MLQAFTGFIFIMIPVILIGFIVSLKTKEKKKRYELEADLCAKAIEKGQELPKNLFERQKKNWLGKTNLEKGIILISLGTGIALFLFYGEIGILHGGIDDAYKDGSIGFIPVGMGVGYLLIHFLGRKQKQKSEDDQ